MKAIVTGGMGFIGGHLTETLAASGWAVHVVDDLRAGVFIPLPPGVELEREAVADARPPLTGVDAIFHLAGPVGPVGVLAYAGRLAAEVVADAATVGRWAALAGCPLVYVSTSEVYGAHDGPTDELTDRVIAAGHSARAEYAAAKLAAEIMLLNIERLDVRVVRPFNVAGPRQRVYGGFVLPRFVAQAIAGEPLTVYRPGSQERAFSHVRDVVDGLLAVLERGQRGEVYNLGNAANRITVVDLAELVIRSVGRVGSYRVIDPVSLWGPGFREAPDKLPDASKARDVLGWRPAWGIRETVRDTLAWAVRLIAA